MEQPAGSEEADPGTTDPATAGPRAVEQAETVTRAPAVPSPAAPVRDPQESEPRPRSLYARMKLFFFRTTLGRTRRDKSDV